MRVGVLTIHHVTNYGLVLQAYALSQALSKRGVEVEIIDYRPQIAVEWYRQGVWRNGRPNLVRHLWARTFERFVDQSLPLTQRRYDSYEAMRSSDLSYDAIIAGSDQIWCTGEGSFRGYDPAFFLGCFQNQSIAKYSYAASAGNTIDFGSSGEEIRRSLDQFVEISVRDDRTAELIAQSTGRSSVVVLDPVFLHDFHEFVHGCEPTNELIVFASRPERFRQAAQVIAERHRLRIVSLVNRSDRAHQCHRLIGPVQWVRKIRQARVVLTDYFHGLAVALRFGRPVLADAAAGKANKMADLARRLGVEEQFLPISVNPREAIDRAICEPEWYQQSLKVALREPLDRSEKFLDGITARENAGALS